MMSRMTIRLQRSPSCSSVRLIGQPDRPVCGTAALPDFLIAYASRVSKVQLLAKYKWLQRGTINDVAGALRSSLLLVHAESARRAVRERHPLRVLLPRAGYAAALGRVAAALAAP